MKSISGTKWSEKTIDINLVEKVKQDYDYSETISKIILSRKFDESEIYSIDNNIQISNVFKENYDYKKSIEIVSSAILNKEKICIFGDYDVDGSAATSLFIRFFKSINQDFFYYIPDREKDGYGPSIEVFKKLIKKKPKLIIMVDCGSTSHDAIKFLNLNNIKSIIIDHHEIDKPYPEANCIINPKKNNGYIEYEYFCATTLTYYFIDLLKDIINKKFNITDYLIYVLLASVCDVMPLRKINRFIAKIVINKFKINKNKVFSEIFNIKGNKKNINIDDLGYLIGPILNSGGRLGKSFYATELLSSDNENEIINKTKKLILLNEKRKIIENRILNEIDFDAIDKKNENIITLYNPYINEGLIGIVAARIKEYFNKPTIIITNSKDTLKGSARSIAGFNIGLMIKNSITKKILIKGGGHQMAGGFTLKKNKLNLFKNYINKYYITSNFKNDNRRYYDGLISSSALNYKFYDEIKKISPFGTGNPEPYFLFKDLKILKPKVLKKKHVFCMFQSRNNKSIRALSFNSINTQIGYYLINYKKKVNVIGQIKENFWNNKNYLQIIIKDIII